MIDISIILLAFSKQIKAIPFIWKAKALPQKPPSRLSILSHWLELGHMSTPSFKGVWESSIQHRGTGFMIDLRNLGSIDSYQVVLWLQCSNNLSVSSVAEMMFYTHLFHFPSICSQMQPCIQSWPVQCEYSDVLRPFQDQPLNHPFNHPLSSLSSLFPSWLNIVILVIDSKQASGDS